MENFEHLSALLDAARHDPKHLDRFNAALDRLVPFNRPHHLSVEHLTEGTITVRLPYEEANLNHVRSLHACGLATAAEFASGLFLLQHVNPARYRLLMKSLSITYLRQGLQDALVTVAPASGWIQNEVLTPLEAEGRLTVPLQIDVRDVAGEVLCQVTVAWHLKAWSLLSETP